MISIPTRMDILEQLSGLTAEQLREVAGRASALLTAQKSTEPMSDVIDERVIYEVVSDAISRRGSSAPPFKVMAKAPHYPSFKEGASGVSKYVMRYLKPKSRAEQHKAVFILVRMLLRWMQEAGVPVSSKTVAQNLHRIPELVEQQFPGYRQSGFLPVLLRKHRV